MEIAKFYGYLNLESTKTHLHHQLKQDYVLRLLKS